MKNNNLVIGIYYHPEVFPPTLNAISELGSIFNNIFIVYRPNLKGNWKYPGNVTEVSSGKYISSKDQEKAGTFRKAFFFVRFTFDLYKSILKSKPSTVLLYDSLALLSYSLISPCLFLNIKIWYHNHDIAEIERTKKFSLGWFACRNEQKYFSKIDLFTLPTEERLRFFPITKLKGQYVIIPNYPSRKFYDQFYYPKKLLSDVKLVFQGRVGEGHGLEEIIPLLKYPISGKQLRLVLKGYCEETYMNELKKIAKENNVQEQLEFIGFTPYEDVPRVTAGCDIGIAIFAGKDVMNITLGKASNKIYEYAALGLPVIYLKNSGVSGVLRRYEWAIPVEKCSSSMQLGIEKIIDQYDFLSAKAYQSFCDNLNYEHYFNKIPETLF